MNVILDIDDVLANFVGDFARWNNEKHGTRLQREDFSTYNLHDHLECSVDEVLRRITTFLYSSPPILTPIPGSQKGVEQLIARGMRPHVVTARKSEWAENTIDWLGRHYNPSLRESLHFSGNPHIRTSGRTKAEIAQELGAELAFEDSLRYTAQYVKANIPVILFDAPWNRQISHRLVYRVKGWEDVAAFFEPPCD